MRVPYFRKLPNASGTWQIPEPGKLRKPALHVAACFAQRKPPSAGWETFCSHDLGREMAWAFCKSRDADGKFMCAFKTYHPEGFFWSLDEQNVGTSSFAKFAANLRGSA